MTHTSPGLGYDSPTPPLNGVYILQVALRIGDSMIYTGKMAKIQISNLFVHGYGRKSILVKYITYKIF